MCLETGFDFRLEALVSFMDKEIEDTSPLFKWTNLYQKKELMDWSVLTALVLPLRSRLGSTGFDVRILLRALILGGFVNSCSSPDLEKTLTFRFDFMLFCDLPATGRKPDHSMLN